MQKKKSILISFFALVLAACLALGLFLSLPKKVSADAVTDVVEEITLNNASSRSDQNIFNQSAVEKLISKILNNSNKKTVADLKTALDSKQALGSGYNITNAKAYNATELFDMSGGEFNVMFGGKQWTPTYLSYDINNNVILTLWISEAQLSDLNVKFNNWSNNSLTEHYPACMYSTSYVRAYLNGKEYVETQANAGTNGAGGTLTSGADVQSPT